MGTFWKDNLLRFLPREYAIQDAQFQDLAAMCEILAIPVDDIQDAVDSFDQIFDIGNCPAKYLPYIARMLNYPLTERDTEASQRIQLKNAVDWYKRKGLEESFRILFYSLGYVINLVELWTRDYKTFHQYPGIWQPPVFPAKIEGTSLVMVDINDHNRHLLISIDGSPEVGIALTRANNRLLTAVAAEINSAISIVGGKCQVPISGKLTISSLISGASSSVRIFPVELSGYQILGFPVGISYGIDYRVPDDWNELAENGGDWYKSPHFGIEVQSIKDYVIDPDEFFYVRDRIELIRPAHTVLDFINYIKKLADAFNISEDDLLGTIIATPNERWPFAACLDRGSSHEYEYLRNGLVPNRSEITRIAYHHKRNARNDCFRRDAFVYTYTNLTRNHVSGPSQMSDRSVPRHFRGGVPEGEPTRRSCENPPEILEAALTVDDVLGWCAVVDRRGGLRKRDNPTDYKRDGSFTILSSRCQTYFFRSGDPEGEFTRFVCKRPLEAMLDTKFTRPDFPGIWFRSLQALSDPDVLGIITQFPFPDRTDTNLQ